MPSPAVDVGLKGGLITGGLGRPACSGIITALPFQLGCFIFIPPPAIETTDGGARPLAPGEIHDFYQPVDQFGYDLVDGDSATPEIYGKKHVRVKVTSRFFEGEKEFIITQRRFKATFKVINMINATINNIKGTVNNIRVIASNAIVKIKKFKWRIKNE